MMRCLEEQMAMFKTALKESNVLLNDHVVPISLSPFFISQEEYEYLQYLCEQVLSAIEIVLRLYVNEPNVQAMFPELKNIRELSCIKPLYKHWIHLARFDIIKNSEGKFQLLETNADCPGGIIFMGKIKECYEQLPIFKMLVESNETITQAIDQPSIFIKSLVSLYQTTHHTSALPNIAFLSSLYRPLSMEMGLLADMARSMGLNSEHLWVQDLEPIEQGLGWGKTKVNIAYQKCDAFINEQDQVHYCLYENNMNEVHDYLIKLKAGDFIAVNSFPSILVAENKRILALLQHPDFQVHFSTEQNNAIKELCPTTFFLSDCTGAEREKIEEVMVHKNKYVLKRVIDTQGRGVNIGCQCTATNWKELIKEAINRPFIVQNFISQSPQLVYSSEVQPKLTRMYTTLSMFLIQGKATGLMARSSPELLTNVNQKGIVQNVYVTKK